MPPIMYDYVIPTVHIASCLFLIVVVLLQTGKGADMGAVFGGGSQTLFGSSGAGNFLTKLTTATAIIFMITSLILTYGRSRSSTDNLLQRLPDAPVAAVPAPGTPTENAPAPAAADQPAPAADTAADTAAEPAAGAPVPGAATAEPAAKADAGAPAPAEPTPAAPAADASAPPPTGDAPAANAPTPDAAQPPAQ